LLKSIKKILIANRGEIANRIIRSAHDLDIATVSIYSEVDSTSPHVLLARQSIGIGGILSSESYLDIDKIINACKVTGADAVHPGYGFLSENAEFARRCEAENIIFIGPNAETISIMGDKLSAKKKVTEFNVPLVPGMDLAITDLNSAMNIADEIGYPVMIKASAGGGGKGIRIVYDKMDFKDEMKRAMSESKSSFGSDQVFIEKFILAPKHIEVQIIGDQYGNYAALFERDCSIQRRNQKVIEEAPCSLLTDSKRKEICALAIKVAESCNYVGAGTVEFIADQSFNFYFLEMNTRLQVEHPVTEQITSVDLVKEQIKVAMGEPLSINNKTLKINGHSIEVRIYAEDPANNFLPDVGKLTTYKIPKGPGIRVDDGFEEGMNIPIQYDPMIAKLISHGSNREEARKRMLRAIDEYKISGIETTLGFCKFALEHPLFINGTFTTSFVSEHFTPDLLTKSLDHDEEIVAVIVAINGYNEMKSFSKTTPKQNPSNWKSRSKK
jgi:acetyl-CoA carboxylase, biotin carboxylase subunit